MNSESNAKTPRTQSAKPTSYKRVHRANRPILVTAETAEAHEPTAQEMAEVMPPVTQIAVEERPSAEPAAPRRRLPTFFTSIGKESQDTPEADPKAARLARALRNKKSVERGSEEAASEKKPGAASAKALATPKRPPSRFKMRYLWGMMIYVLIAEYLGTLVTSYMNANHLNAPLFQLGSFVFDRATLVFLALLVVILMVMARFDLIPSSLKSMVNGSPSGNVASARKDGPATFDTRASAVQPTVKQGIKGSNDDLYQEYRANQRYFQKRDRKR